MPYEWTQTGSSGATVFAVMDTARVAPLVIGWAGTPERSQPDPSSTRCHAVVIRQHRGLSGAYAVPPFFTRTTLEGTVPQRSNSGNVTPRARAILTRTR